MSVDRIPPSLAISVGVHAVLAVGFWLVQPGSDREETVAVRDTTIDLVEAAPGVTEPEPVAVVVLDPATLASLPELPAPAAPDPRPATSRATPRPAAIARAATAIETVKPEGPAVPSPWADMRKGRDLEGRGRVLITTPSLERIASGIRAEPESVIVAPAGPQTVDAPAPSTVTAEITPGGRGGYKINDLTFKGRIEADGSVAIKDKSNLQHQFTSWKNVKKVLREEGPFGLLKVGFDVTDAMMRKYKQDPYASRKLAFLDQTRDQRVEIGRRYRKEVLTRTAEIVHDNLEVMWAATKDTAKRKEALFEMWDEVDETSDDESVVEAGKAARSTVIGFLRAKFPAGSANAFTADEIARFNSKRHSKAAFAPYE